MITLKCTREQAYQAMQDGNKISHASFTDGEFLYMKDGIILDEDGNNFIEGWRMRVGDDWDNRWIIIDVSDHPVVVMLQKELAEYQRCYAEFDHLRTLFTKHNGKTTRIFKNADFAKFKFTEQYGQMYLHGEFRHFIGYVGRDSKLDPVALAERAVSTGAASERHIENIRRMDVHQLIKVWETIKGHYEGLREAFGDLNRGGFESYNNPIFYPMLEMIQCAEDIPHGTTNIKLSDLWYVRK